MGLVAKVGGLKKLPRAQRKLKREQQTEQLQVQVQQIAAEVRRARQQDDGGSRELHLKVDELQALMQQQAQSVQELLLEFRRVGAEA